MTGASVSTWIVVGCALLAAASGLLQAEPARAARHRVIALNEPQMFCDDYFVDNRYNEEFISARVPHVLHRGERLAEPLLTRDDEKPWECGSGIGYPSVLYDAEADLFRLYYTTHTRPSDDNPLPGYCVCYAQSKDGLNWDKPLFDVQPWGDLALTNIVLRGRLEGKIAHVHTAPAEAARPDGERIRNLGMLPAEDLRGHRFVAYYCDHEHYLATSEDGIHWQQRQQMILPNRVDCYQTIVRDAAIGEYVIFYRNKLIYDPARQRAKGNTRMITRLASPELWSLWDGMADTVLIPDGDDAGRFYSMPTFLYGGVYWGMLAQFAESPQTIEVELVWSRDGFNWERAPGRPMFIPVGEPGAWDDGMVFAADRVIERGDEWWLYYTGHNGYHDEQGRSGSVGLVKLRKEGFVSIRADERGQESYLVTRPILWPGGDLVINADASKGSVKVAVVDANRMPHEGLGCEDCVPFEGDAVRHRVQWKNAGIASLKGEIVRLEFAFRRADLFAFLAADEETAGAE